MEVREVDMSKATLVDVTKSEYEQLVLSLLEQVGVSKEHAKITAYSLADADRSGVYTHGIFRLPHYIKQIKKGHIHVAPHFSWDVEGPLIHKLDADHALGSVAGHYAMRKAIQLAEEKGTGLVSVRRSNHFGTAAFYAELASARGLLAFVASTSSKAIAPTGSVTPLLGNNPWSVSFPTFAGPPITLDMANSVVARGKMRIAAAQGEKIPFGWALDSEGNPTENPLEALKGIILPVGDHKGYGIALLLEILAGILTGAAFGENKTDLDDEGKRDVGHLMFAMPIESWLPIREYKKRIGELIQAIKEAERIEGVEEVWLPGEIEARNKQRQGSEVVRLPVTNWNRVCEFAARSV